VQELVVGAVPFGDGADNLGQLSDGIGNDAVDIDHQYFNWPLIAKERAVAVLTLGCLAQLSQSFPSAWLNVTK